MIDVEERGVCAFEEEGGVVAEHVVKEVDGVVDVGAEAFAPGGGLFEEALGIDVGVDAFVGDGGEAGEGAGLEGAGEFEAVAEEVGGEEIADADGGGAVVLVGVGGADAAAGGAEGAVGGFWWRGSVGEWLVVGEAGEDAFAEFVFVLVEGEDGVGAGGDDEVGGVDLLGGEGVEFVEEGLGIDDDAVADDGLLVGGEDACGDEVERVALAGDGDGMAGVCAAVVADDGVEGGGE